jgi:NNP family nitrate/nitrite transporter-like MFS transporter
MTPTHPDPAGPRLRVLCLSTFAFTVLFAVWLMLGVLGLKIKADPALLLGEAAATMTPAEVKDAADGRFEWLLAVAILAGSLPRLHFGIWADRYGGRAVMTALLLGTAVPTYLVAHAESYLQFLVCAALFGLAGNAFSIGIAWNSAWFPAARKGTALGVFGAGNVGASGTKLLVVLVPTVLTLVPPTGYFSGLIPGGWRVVPVFYAVVLVLTAAAIRFVCPAPDRKPGRGRPTAEMLAPMRHVRVWRFSLYYVVVFGAYVALSAWLPNYYVSTYGLSLRDASLLTALYIFPASLLRPVGGWLSDVYGPRAVTVATFLLIAAATVPLCLPTSVLPLGAGAFTALLVVVGVGMGVGKGSVFKYIPNYFPADVGAVGGLVGLFGGLGGFILPKLFGWLGRATGFPQAAFLALLGLTLVSLAWLVVVIARMNRKKRAVTREGETPVTVNRDDEILIPAY